MMQPVTVEHGDMIDVLARYPAGGFVCGVGSPRYNLGHSPSAREHPNSSRGLAFRDWAYEDDDDNTPEPEYQNEQVAQLQAIHRVMAAGSSFFYVHKDRVWEGRSISPRAWLDRADQPFTVRQQITWDRTSTHNMNGYNFDPVNEWVFWLTKGRVSRNLGTMARWGTVWRIPVIAADRVPWHPCPFPRLVPERCILALSDPGDVILDPWAGASTTGVAARRNGRGYVGIDRQARYVVLGRERVLATPVIHPVLQPQQAALL